MRAVRLDELAEIVNPSPGRKVLALLAAYLDGSLKEQPLGVTSVAGYIAPLSEWKRVERKWTRGLEEWRIKRFRLAELPRLVGNHKASLCERYFEQLIRDCSLHAVGAALLNIDWHRTDWAAHNIPRFESLYEQCLDLALNTLGNHSKRCFAGERVAIVCCQDAVENHRDIQPQQRKIPKFMTITVGSSIEIMPLQCADLGTGMLRRSWKAIIDNSPEGRELEFGTLPHGKPGRRETSFWSLIQGAVLARAVAIANQKVRE